MSKKGDSTDYSFSSLYKPLGEFLCGLRCSWFASCQHQLSVQHRWPLPTQSIGSGSDFKRKPVIPAERRPLGKANTVIITLLPQKQSFASKVPFMSFTMQVTFTLICFAFPCSIRAGEERGKEGKKTEWRSLVLVASLCPQKMSITLECKTKKKCKDNERGRTQARRDEDKIVRERLGQGRGQGK